MIGHAIGISKKEGRGGEGGIQREEYLEEGGPFFVVSTITCPRTGSVHKVARRLMNFEGIDADHPQTQRNYF